VPSKGLVTGCYDDEDDLAIGRCFDTDGDLPDDPALHTLVRHARQHGRDFIILSVDERAP
jgi:hypothetical protein